MAIPAPELPAELAEASVATVVVQVLPFSDFLTLSLQRLFLRALPNNLLNANLSFRVCFPMNLTCNRLPDDLYQTCNMCEK